MAVDGNIRAITLYLVELSYDDRVVPYEWSAATDRRFPSLLAEVSSEKASGWGEGGLIISDPLAAEPTLLDIWLEAASRCLLGRPIASFRALGELITADPLPSADGLGEGRSWQSARSGPLAWEPIATAVESALWDLFAREAGVPLTSLFGPGERPFVPVAPCIGRFKPREAAKIAAGLADEGFHSIKLKGGRGVELDVEITSEVRAAVGADVLLRLDPNGAYGRIESLRLARSVERLGLEYLEQPCPPNDFETPARLRRSTQVPIALDEAVLGPESVVQINAAGAADVVLLEMHQLRGLSRLLETAAVAKAVGLALGMHSPYATGVRTACVLQLVAACPEFRCAPDSLYHALASDVLATPLHVEGGRIAVPEGAGLGVEVDRERVEALVLASVSRTADLLGV